MANNPLRYLMLRYLILPTGRVDFQFLSRKCVFELKIVCVPLTGLDGLKAEIRLTLRRRDPRARQRAANARRGDLFALLSVVGGLSRGRGGDCRRLLRGDARPVVGLQARQAARNGDKDEARASGDPRPSCELRDLGRAATVTIPKSSGRCDKFSSIAGRLNWQRPGTRCDRRALAHQLFSSRDVSRFLASPSQGGKDELACTQRWTRRWPRTQAGSACNPALQVLKYPK